MGLLDGLARSALFSLDPEVAHGLSIAALRCGLPPVGAPHVDPRLAVSVAGIAFPNLLGMAAGYDKNGEVPDALLRLGFGFAEVGTVTPRAQPGNPKPRIFRLPDDEAVINRLGFNNEGHEPLEARLTARAGRPGIVGVNIGANKDTEDRVGDYELGVKRFARHASYLTVNISSPNTPGLRNMQAREILSDLLSRVISARDADPAGKRPPIFLKIAPDLHEAELEDVAAEVLDKQVEGLIVSNTTLARTGLKSGPRANETGGLSGKPLFERATATLAKMRQLVGPELAIIGVGGVDSAATALEKVRAGADLVQLYTGMIYAGPGLPGKILRDLSKLLDDEKVTSIGNLRDSRLDHWADRAL